MKKTKRIMSMAVAVLMAASMLPGAMLQNASAATATNTNAGMSNIGSVTLSNFEDFEGFGEEGVEGTTLFTGTETEQTFNLSSYLTLSIKGEGNKAEIVKDPVTNSYALKITHTGDGGNIALSNWFSTKKSNLSATATAHAGYKARFEHYAADTWLKRFNAIVDSKDWYGIARIMGFGDSLYLDPIRDFSIGLQKNYSDKYLDGEMYYNSYNKVRVITHRGQTFEHGGNNTNPMARALFNITGATGATSANYYGKGSADEPTVIWLDDIYFETIDYKVKSATVGGVFEQGEPLTNVPLNAPINVKMTDAVSDDCVSGEYITLTDSEGSAVDFTVEKDSESGFTVYPMGQKTSENYTLTVKAGMKSTINNAVTTVTDKVIAFTTKAWSPYIYEDEFEGFEIGQKWDGPQTVKLGNASVTLEAGDSIEYALDKATGKVGFKLVKGTATGNLDFKYIFPEGFKDGKYRVYVDERIENWSKAFYCWPALLDGDGVITSARGNRMTGSYWFVETGNYKGTDRFGFDWSEVNDSRWISGYDVNKNYKVAGELTTGTAYRIGLLDPETSETTWSRVEPATDVDTLGGVSMRINGGETDLSKAIYKGTQNNDNGVAWIYSIAVEKVALEVKGSSVESALDSFDPVGKVTVSFNDRVASSKVNNDTVKLYKADTLVEDVAVTLSDNMKNVTIEPAEGWLYNTEYKIVVDGVEGYDAVVGTAKAKTFAFKTLKKTGFEIDDIEPVEGGIVTTLYNNCDDNQKFITIGVAKDATGKITEIKFGDSGYVQANSNKNIAVEFDNAAASYELYVWDGIDTMNPLVKKN